MAEKSALAGVGRSRRIRIPWLEIWLILVLIVAYMAVPKGANAAIIWSCLLVQYVLLVASVWRPITIYRDIPTYFSAEFLFLFFAYLIFFYPYQLHVLGILDVSQSRYFPGNAFPEQSNHAIILSLVGTVAFRAGTNFVQSASHQSRPKKRRLDSLTVEDLTFPVFALQLVLMVAYEFVGLKAAGEGRYSDAAVGGALADGIYLWITVLAMVTFALVAFPSTSIEPRSPIFLWLAVLLSTVWAVRILLAGDRNSFMLIAIVAAGGILTFRFRGGRMALALLCAFGLTLYTAIAQLRSERVDSLLDFVLSGGPLSTAAGDRDTSFNITTITLRAALANVPENLDYGYGIYKLIGFAGVVPFIRGVLIPPEMSYIQSSDVLTDILLGPSASWGVGSNVIVDVYLDFGLVGVPILLFALGLAMKYVQNSVARSPASLWRAVFYLVTMALVAETPRYSLAFPVRPLLWVLLLFGVVSLLSSTLDSRRNRAQSRVRSPRKL
nr:O-antigen polysaccharide polymerase Wzy [Mycolicibacterium holsaticum]